MSRFNLFSVRRNRDRQSPGQPPLYTPNSAPPPSYAFATAQTSVRELNEQSRTGIWSAMGPDSQSLPVNRPHGSRQYSESNDQQRIDLPLDIVFRIAHFIPETDLKNLLTVSPAFFELAMDARYRRISFYDLGNAKLMRRLERLRDPTVAKRVRNLHVRLFLNVKFVHLWREKGAGKQKFRWTDPEHEVMSFVTDLVADLTNVVEFTIGYWDKNVESYLSPFFTAAWDTFGSTLQKLSIEGGTDPSKIPLPPSFLPSLREMHFLIPGSKITSQATNGTANFMNACGSSSMRNLSISSWGSWDMSPFCHKLGPFQVLERLRISMPFNETMSDPGGLTHLLSIHASGLRHVYLRLDPSREEGEGNLGRWMCANVLDQVLLRNLQTLEVSLSPLADFSTLMTFVKRSENTLTKLVIMHRFCSFEDVAAITGAFAHRPANSGLQSLGLNVQFFEPRLLDLLSDQLPNLYELNLKAFNWGEEHWDADEREDAFRREIRKRTYDNWRLFDIGVWLRLGYDEMVMKMVEYEDMLLLVESMPSVQKIWGKYILTRSFAAEQ